MTRSTDSSGPPDDEREAPSHSGAAPHNIEAEEALLGAMLLSEEAIANVLSLVTADELYRPAHKAIFEAILAVYDRGQGEQVDPLTVNDAMEGDQALASVGGPAYLVSLLSKAPVIGHAPRYAAIVREHAVRRQMIATGQELIASGRQPSTEAELALTEVGSVINDMTLSMRGEQTYTTSEYSSQALDDLVEAWSGGNKKGAKTGFKQLDDLTNGLHRGRLYILGARPGMGKSVLGVNIATEFAVRQHKTVLFFSLEMDAKEIAQRSLYGCAMQHSKDMENAWMSHSDWIRVAEAQADFRKSNLVIDDTASIDIQMIEARCRQEAARTGGLDLVVIDYLQLMGGGSAKFENRQVEVAALSKRLKGLARNLDVPVLALSQLTRKLEDRLDKRPQLSDLRESGSLEQDADCVIFLYRDSEYVEDSEDEGFAEAIVAKNRQGPQGVARLAWIPEMSMFGNVSTAA